MSSDANNHEEELTLRQRIIDLTQHLEAARGEVLRLSSSNAELVGRVAELQAASATIHQSRRAALNVMEDAVRSNEVAEKLNAELKHEIAERERAQTELRTSEDRLRILADAVPQIIWANDAAGAANYFNRRWYDYSDLTFEQSAGLGWEAIVHPDDAATSKQRWQEALASGEAFDTEYRLRRADGAYRWFIGRNVPVRDAQGRVMSWFGTATDIQELKEAQAVAREREEQFRRAIEDAPIPVIMYAEDGEVLKTSRAWTEVTGYAAEEIPEFHGWLTRTYGHGGQAVRERLQHVFQGAQTVEQVEFELASRSGGRRHWLFSVSSPGTLPNGRRYAVGMAIDLTERKRAEQALAASQEHLRLIVEGALEHAIISIDLDRRVSSWNTGAERILGFMRDEIAQQSCDTIFTPEDRAAGMPLREVQLALARGRAADERWHMRKNGSRFWGSGVMLPIYEQAGGAATGFVKILRDETERRAAQQALEASRQELMGALRETERARAEAEAAMRAKDDFLAALSHELRTPLNPVLLLASEAAETESIPQALRESFETIRNNVQLEARLIDDLLDLTRISRGKLPLDCRHIDGHAVLREAAAIVQMDATQKNIDLTLELTAVSTSLQADPVRLQQVFWNVLKNAVKFTPDGGSIVVQTRNSEGYDRLVVSVTDNGIGMTATEIERVFQAFAQGDHAENSRSSHRFGGLGLGLAISRTLAELHGGGIRAMSGGPDRGSTFEIDLPTAGVDMPLKPLPRVVHAVLEPGQLEQLQHERIVLVEDHAPTRVALAMLLRRRHLKVETADSIAEARRVAEREGVTLLLSDIGLPDGSGYDLMREFRERYGARGVALTGYGTESDVAKSQSSGFTAHVTKPVSAQALDRTLALLAARSEPTHNAGDK